MKRVHLMGVTVAFLMLACLALFLSPQSSWVPTLRTNPPPRAHQSPGPLDNGGIRLGTLAMPVADAENPALPNEGELLPPRATAVSFSNSMSPGGRMPSAQSQTPANFLTVNGEPIPTISVQGHVRRPGRYVWPAVGHDQTVLDAIQVAGGFDSVANGAAVRVTHQNANRSVNVLVVNTEAPPGKGISAAPSVTVHPGDVVFVPERLFPAADAIFVAGAVKNPGSYFPTAQNHLHTLLEAIGAAGGFAPTADLSRVEIAQKTPTGFTTTLADVNAILKNTAADPVLMLGQSIYVGTRKQ